MAPTLLTIPGLNGSGPDHWQTHWEAAMPPAVRVEQADWDQPRLEPWLAALMTKITEHPDAILVAHSLGCALVANAVKREPAMKVRAAMLVSPSDVDWINHIEDTLRDFAPMPLDRF